MKNCGLFSVSLGIESGVERQLKEWRKGITLKQGLSALNICKKLNVIVQMGYIMLDRGTTIKELREHLNFLKKTKFTVTKGIYSCIFAAEGTDIAKTYKKHKKRIDDKKRGINIEYSFKQEPVKILADNLKTWSKAYGGIYSMAVDLLSAPRALSLKKRTEILRIVQVLKLIDYEIIEGLITFTEKNDYLSMKYFLSEKIKKKKVFMTDIKNKLIAFYDKNGLFFEEKENLYIK